MVVNNNILTRVTISQGYDIGGEIRPLEHEFEWGKFV